MRQAAYDGIWPKFKLTHAFMNEADQIKKMKTL